MLTGLDYVSPTATPSYCDTAQNVQDASIFNAHRASDVYACHHRKSCRICAVICRIYKLANLVIGPIKAVAILHVNIY